MATSQAGTTTPQWGKAAGTAIGAYFGGAQGAAAGGEAGNFLDGLAGAKDYYSTRQYKRGRRHARADALWNLNNIYGQEIQTRAKDAEAAGLHPLAALGISAGGSAPAQSTAASGIPGQHDSGSSLGTALNRIAKGQQASKIGKMRVQEQTLRNEWLQTQIDNQKLKNAELAANAQNPAPDELVRPAVPNKAHYSEGLPVEVILKDGKRATFFGSTPAEQYEKYMGELSTFLPENFHKYYQVARQQYLNYLNLVGDEGSPQHIKRIDSRLKKRLKPYKADKNYQDISPYSP